MPPRRRGADGGDAGSPAALQGAAGGQHLARRRRLRGEGRRALRKALAPAPRRSEIDVNEARARVEAEALEPDRAGRGLEGLGVVVRHGDVESDPLHVLRCLRPADRAVVLRAPVGRADDERLSEPKAQRLQGVERRLVDKQLAGAAAGDLGRREVRPAPGGRRHVAPMRIDGYRVLRKQKGPRNGGPGWYGHDWGDAGAVCAQPLSGREKEKARRTGCSGPVQQGDAATWRRLRAIR